MATHPDGGEWEWRIESILPDEPRHSQIPITRVTLRCGERWVRVMFQTIKKPTGKMYIRTVAQGSQGGMLIKDLPREAKKLICSAYAVALLVE